MGLSAETVEGSIRIGVGKETTEQEVDEAAKLIQQAVQDCHQAIA